MPKPKSISDIFNSSTNEFVERFVKKQKYINYEFQDIGYEIATKLNDDKHKSLYMRMAKNTPEHILRQALSFALDYPLKYGNNRAKVFMWKIKDIKIKSEKQIKQDDKINKD